MLDRLKKIFAHEKEEGEHPEGRWILITWDKARDRCGRVPKVAFHMLGDRAVDKEVWDEAKRHKYEGRYPIVPDSRVPCTEGINDYTAFGALEWKEREMKRKVKG